MGYLPLDYIIKNKSFSIEPSKNFIETTKMFFRGRIHNLKEYSDKDYEELFCSPKFLTTSYNGPCKELNFFMMQNPQVVLGQIGATMADVRKGHIGLDTEWRDILYSGLVMEKWERFKQVYKLDKDFVDALVGTEKLTISRSALMHLPCNTFYLDVSECELLNPFHGAYINVNVSEETFSIDIIMLRNDMMYFSWYERGFFDANGLNEHALKTNMDDYSYTFLANRGLENGNRADFEKVGEKLPRQAFANLVEQILCYITSKEPDISPNPVTQTTYKPSPFVKNKFSEIKMDDVGVRYGTTLRLNKEKIKEELKRQEVEAETENVVSNTLRKKPRPYFKNAYWQRYHVGVGRSETILKWIEPQFVGFGELDLVIHKVVDENTIKSNEQEMVTRKRKTR